MNIFYGILLQSQICLIISKHVFGIGFSRRVMCIIISWPAQCCLCMMEECLLQVRDALASKVSKERVGTELEGMFKGMRHAAACMQFLKGNCSLGQWTLTSLSRLPQQIIIVLFQAHASAGLTNAAPCNTQERCFAPRS